MAGINWKKMLTITAAIAGVGAAAVMVIRRIRSQGRDVEDAIDEMLDFCKDKAAELDRLVNEMESVPGKAITG